MRSSHSPEDVLDFWFTPPARDHWFKKNPWFDDEIRACFGGLYEQARMGELASWRDEPHGALALVIVLDQFPRNMFRGGAEAFATDDAALAIADEAIARGFDARLGEEERVFLYMPYMHSEALSAQRRGVTLYAALGRPEQIDYMRRHHDIIERFGRFPHRNATLGRVSTPEEQAFLATPGSSF